MTKYALVAVLLWVFAMAGASEAGMTCSGTFDQSTGQTVMYCDQEPGALEQSWNWTKRQAVSGWSWTKEKSDSMWKGTKNVADKSWSWTKNTSASAWSTTKEIGGKIKAWWNE